MPTPEDILEKPPRLTGTEKQDIHALNQYVWSLWRNFIEEGGVLLSLNQSEETLNADSGGIRQAWPVGSIFFSTVEGNPAELLGYGTWESFGAGRMPVGVDTAEAPDPDFDEAEETGGAKSVTPTGVVSQPTFTGSALATHQHGPGARAVADHSPTTQGVTAGADFNAVTAIDSHVVSGDDEAVSAGTPSGTVSQPNFMGDAQDNMPPYITVYMWKRTA